jgi:hypothetical protein
MGSGTGVQKRGRKAYSEAFLKKKLPEIVKGTGGIASVLSKKLGVDISTFFRYQKKYPWIGELRQMEREVILDTAEAKLFKKMQNEEDWAIIYTLSTLGKHRGYGNEAKIEHTGRVDSINVSVVKVLKNEDELEHKD